MSNIMTNIQEIKGNNEEETRITQPNQTKQQANKRTLQIQQQKTTQQTNNKRRS